MKKFIIPFCFLGLLIYFFVVFETNFKGPDATSYYAYTESIVEDKDLNLVNNIEAYPDCWYAPWQKLGVSSNFNLVNFHNHGGILVWKLFYNYGKLNHFLVNQISLQRLSSYSLERFIKLAMSFSTVILGFFVLILSYLLSRVFFSNRLSFFSILAIFFGTPFFYYLLFENGNAQIMATFFSIVMIWALFYTIQVAKRWHWFVCGLFFGICLTIKVDLWFQLFFIAAFFLSLIILKKAKWINGLFFIFGILPALVLKIINDYIKYGVFYIGEAGPLNLKDSYLFEMLFSSYRGYFYTSPILYFCLLGLVMVVLLLVKDIRIFKKSVNFDSRQSRFLIIFILSAYLFLKIPFISYRYAWSGTIGARVLLTGFPIFVLLYAFAYQIQRRAIKKIFVFITIIFIFWNFLIISEYLGNLDLSYLYYRPGLIDRVSSLENVVALLIEPKDLYLKLAVLLLPVLSAGAFGFYLLLKLGFKDIPSSFWYDESKVNNSGFKVFLLFTLFLSVSYGYVTFLNIRYNRSNVERMKKVGVFENTYLLSIEEFDMRHNISCFNQTREYFLLRGDYQRVRSIEEQKEKMYSGSRLWQFYQTD